MFKSIGRFTDRHRRLLVVLWVGVAIIITAIAPPLEEIATNDTSDFLPDDVPSIAGLTLVEKYFPSTFQTGNITLVFHAETGTKVTEEANTAFITQVSNWLISDDAPHGIHQVQSPILDPQAAAALISGDEKVAIIVLNLNLTEEVEIRALMSAVEEQLAAAPAGLSTYRTGQNAIFLDYDDTVTETVDRTFIVTVVLVILILLVIYRSPISPLVPLFVVTVAYLIVRGIVSLLGHNEVFVVSGIAAMMLIVVMYGSGTDFCLFLINRFREELATSNDVNEGVRNTVWRVGESITSSAGTVFTGFIAMSTAQLGLFNTAGPSLAIAIAVSLLAGLTLTPALLAMLGPRAFWPNKAETRPVSAFYRRTSQIVSSRPLLTVTIIVLIMAPFAVYGSGQNSTYDFLADLNDEVNSVAGFRVLEDHLGAGRLQPLNLVTHFEEAEDPLAAAAELTRTLESVKGVASVSSVTQPFGPDVNLPAIALLSPQVAGAIASFINYEAGTARFEVILSDHPYSTEAMETIAVLRSTLEAIPGEDAVTGTTAINTDIRDILREDTRSTIVLVLVGIFIVLAIMLRSLVAPTYLIGTILLSYGTTLGITRLASQLILGVDTITWWVPFFVFVFLVALGIDYSIFLFGRIKEEVRKHGIHDGIHSAVEATGSIITSAGIIVAGTFGALMGGELVGLAQIGFAVSVGILIDTFVVRTILDPALATFFGKWTWWPGGVVVQPDTSQELPAVAVPSGTD